VLLARQKGIAGFEKPVVIKRILPSLADQADVVEMLLQEAKVAARISHPNVVQIYDLGLSDDQYFIAMEFVNGSDLAVLIRAGRRTGKPAPFAVAARIVADVAGGLQAAHALTDAAGTPTPVVHRDISPHNIMLSAEGAVKLTDFGISKVSDSVVHTMTGVVKGKVPYMAPEQLDSRIGATDHRIDIYQAGVVLAELLLGYSPFHRKNEAESMAAALKGELPDPLPPCQPIPAPLLPIVKKAIARKPQDRYATAEDMQVALEQAIRQLGGQGSDHDVAQWARSLADGPPPPKQPTDEESQTEVVTPRKRRGPI
jgi:eukaryotic-like serine/threonine-protein kinase